MKIRLDGRMIGVLDLIFTTEHHLLPNNPVDPIRLVFTTPTQLLEGSRHHLTTALTLHIITDILLLTTQLIIFHKYYSTIQHNFMAFQFINFRFQKWNSAKK